MTEVNPIPKAPRAAKAIPPKVRLEVHVRARGWCEVQWDVECTRFSSEIHHRRRRSQGGAHVLANLRASCLLCHTHLHAQPAEAHARGLLLRAGDPEWDACGDAMNDERVSSNLLTIRDLAGRIERWHSRELGDPPLPLRALIIAEEAGEVCRAILKAEQGIRGDPARWTEQAAEEAADVVIAALSMLNALAPVAGPPHEVIAARATVVLARQFASAEVKP